MRVFNNDDFADFPGLLTYYAGSLDTVPTNCALAVAAPIHGDQVEMCNRSWHFSKSGLAATFGFKRVEILNDFHALAYCLPQLDDSSRAELGKADAYRRGNIGVLGPGSGLGMAAWIADRGNGGVMSGEGGHISLSGRNATEDEIIARFRDRFGHCSAERVLSGPGLKSLHSVMHGKDVATSEFITAHPADPECAATMQQFFRFLGSAAAELALIAGAYGGIYIAGGIVPACLKQIQNSEFRQRFEDKNRYADYMRSIPTWVITARFPGLLGLAALIDSILDQGS